MNKIKLSLGSGSVALSLLFHAVLVFQLYDIRSKITKEPILYEVSLESEIVGEISKTSGTKQSKKAARISESSYEQSEVAGDSSEGPGISNRAIDGIGSTVYGEKEVDETAKMLSMPTISYPRAAYQKGIEGDVQFQLIINEDGIVVSAELTKPAGNGFDESALNTAKQLKFRPAIKAGKQVAVNIIWNCSFRIEG